MAKKKNKGSQSKKQAAAKQSASPQTTTPTSSSGGGTGSGLSTTWLAAALATIAVGVGLAVYLTNLHLDAVYGSGVAKAVCDFGGKLSCSDVIGSTWASFFPNTLHIPHSVLAIGAYAMMGWFAWGAYKKGRGSFELKALFALSVASVAYGVFLFFVMAFVLDAYCLFCMGMDVVAIVLMVLSWRALDEKPVAALAGVVGQLNPTAVGIGTLVFVLVFGLSFGMYSNTKKALVDSGFEEAVSGVTTEQPAAAVNSNPANKPVVATAPTTATGAAADATAGKSRRVIVQDQRYDIVIPPNAPSLGPKNAKVTIVEFSDFECPFCKRLSGTMHQIHSEYPEDVRIVFLNFPMQQSCNEVQLAKSMHPRACMAAKAGVCANEQGKFWEMHDLMFKRQKKLSGRELGSLGRRAGLDVKKLSDCVDAPATEARVRADTKEAAKASVTGTPAFLVNGRKLIGAQPIEVIRRVIEAELKGEEGRLDLDIQVGAEVTGLVKGAPEMVTIDYGSYPYQIDTFEAALENGKAASRAGAVAAGGLTWFEGDKICKAAGKRMCTEEEWLIACTGEPQKDDNNNGLFSDDLIRGSEYAYGDFFEAGICPDSRTKATVGVLSTGTHPECKSSAGVYDMHGNVKEWVGLSAADAMVKGGSYFSGDAARCAYNRDDIAPGTDNDDSLGVRCCKGNLPAAVAVNPNESPGGKVGDKLMDFKQPLLNGGTFDSKVLKGKPAIIGFWASWCGPCKKEMPILNDLAKKYQAQGLQVVGVTIDETPQKAKDWLAENPMSFPILQDKDSAMVGKFDTRGSVPTTFWVTADGTIRQRTVGVPSGGEQALDGFARALFE